MDSKKAQLAALLAERLAGSQPPPLQAASHPGSVTPVTSEMAYRYGLRKQRKLLEESGQLMKRVSTVNVACGFLLQGGLQVNTLRTALQDLLARQPILTARFDDQDGQINQHTDPSAVLNFQHHRMDFPLTRDTTDQWQEQYRAAISSPFDLWQGPLYQFSLFEGTDQTFLLAVALDHFISDSWSLQVLMDDLSNAYQARLQNPAALPEILPVQFSDYAVWQNSWLGTPYYQKLLDYWGRQLGGVLPNFEMPTDHPRPDVQRTRGARQTLDLQVQASTLKNHCTRLRVTPFVYLLTLYQLLLARQAHKQEVIVLSHQSRRTRPEVAPLVGPFYGFVLLKTDFEGCQTFQDALEKVRETCLDAQAHEDFPPTDLLVRFRSLDGREFDDLPQMYFAASDLPLQLQLPGVQSWLIDLDERTSIYDFSLWVTLDEHCTAVTLYRDDLFESSTVTRMLQDYQQALVQLLQSPDLPLELLFREPVA